MVGSDEGEEVAGVRDPATARARMVSRQLRRRGIADDAVLDAMGIVPREAFVPSDSRADAYADRPLPIGDGQTISQPYIVALMAAELELSPGERVLDVGTGSGYAAAVLSRIAGHVFTVERHRRLAEEARSRFERLGYDNITVRVGDGSQGWAAHAPFDGISVAAAAAAVPEPLPAQLSIGAALVIPTGSGGRQRLIKVERTGEETFEQWDLGPVRFVPLIGDGFDERRGTG